MCPGNQGVEMGAASFTTNPASLLTKFLLPIPVTLGSASIEDLGPKGGRFPSGDAVMVLLNWKVEQPPGHGAHVSEPISTTIGITVLGEITVLVEGLLYWWEDYCTGGITLLEGGWF